MREFLRLIRFLVFVYLGFLLGTFLIPSCIAKADESIYQPLCVEKRCHEAGKNIAYLGTGKGTLNGHTQGIYSFSYLRRFENRDHDNIYLGVQVLGSDKDSIYGGLFHIGYGW